ARSTRAHAWPCTTARRPGSSSATRCSRSESVARKTRLQKKNRGHVGGDKTSVRGRRGERWGLPRAVEFSRSRLVGADQYWSAPTTSPPLSETSPRNVTTLTVSFKKRTLPSPINTLTPPGWNENSSSFAPALFPCATNGGCSVHGDSSRSGRNLLL